MLDGWDLGPCGLAVRGTLVDARPRRWIRELPARADAPPHPFGDAKTTSTGTTAVARGQDGEAGV